MKSHELIQEINDGKFDKKFRYLYSDSENIILCQRKRYIKAIQQFETLFPEYSDIHIYSAPGRTEIGGNHTDHQHGCVLAAAVNLDAIAVVSFHGQGVIRVKSEGYEEFSVSLDNLSVCRDKKKSSEIVRGIAAKFSETGVKIDGFDTYITSDVISGSGLSSSAAFEILIGTIIDIYYNNGRVGAVETAKIGQYTENVYFGKNSGLMDQMVSSVGGLVSIDFHNTESPEIRQFEYNFEHHGYCLCITDTKGNHANLTEDYAEIRMEMEKIASYFHKPFLRNVNETEFYKLIPELRSKFSDRAVMRTAHFFDENNRAVQEAEALQNNDMEKFLELIHNSGESSANLLQNLYSASNPQKQEISIGIMISKKILGKRGAVRVHGGGFAGTIQAFVPVDLVNEYKSEMNRIFGENSCYILTVRPVGGIEIIPEEELI